MTTRLLTAWHRGGKLSGQHNILEATSAYRGGPDAPVKHKNIGAQRRGEKPVPRGTHLFSLSERYFCETFIFTRQEEATVTASADGVIAAAITVPGAAVLDDSRIASVYFGPRDFFYLKRAGLNEALPIGMLGQIGLVCLAILSGIARMTRSYGIATILFSILVGAVTAPFTLMGLRSMKKMQDLKPQVDRIMAQHKGDQKKTNEEVMGLYKKNRVSPLGGCLPMLIQFPIFIALFKAMSHYIDFRGQPFLWIKDLSLPDRLLVIAGFDVNLLPVIMAAAMYVQSRLTRMSAAKSEDPMAKMMSGPMFPIIFGVVSYQFPAGLVLYWTTSTAVSILIYRLGGLHAQPATA